MLESVFQSLDINKTIFIQFGIAISFFFLAKHLFFNKLKEIVLLRESKTTKLVQAADKNLEKSKELNEKIKGELSQVYKDAQDLIDTQRDKVIRETNESLKKSEEEAEKVFNSKRSEFKSELSEKEKTIFKEADNLAHALFEKVTR